LNIQGDSGVKVNIQGDSGVKANILRGDKFSHCEKKVRMNICQIPIVYRDRAGHIHEYKSVVNSNEEK
jgi:hypothetical protein